MPGAEVLVEGDPDAAALAITPPPRMAAREVAEARDLAARIVERARRAGMI